MKNIIKDAFIKSCPIMAGYIVLGIGFGILLKQAGYGLFYSFLMSLTIYAGSMQYVAISLITSGASLLSIAMTTLMVNARHLFYAISMLDKYEDTGMKKPYLIFSLTDETYSLLCNEEIDSKEKKWFAFFVSLFNQSYWICGCCLGSMVGSLFTFDTAGIEFSMTALFVSVLVEQWLTNKNHLPALIGLICSSLCLFLFGKEHFLIPTMLFITIALLFIKKEDKQYE